MNDAELLTAFESCSLPVEQWTHQAHIRVAWIYASTNSPESAIQRIRAGIKAYNKATDTPEAIDRGYHETITVAFMTLVCSAIQKTGPYESSDEFCQAHPELLSKTALRRYYSREQIMTMQAKSEFVDPDLNPLPALDDSCP